MYIFTMTLMQYGYKSITANCTTSFSGLMLLAEHLAHKKSTAAISTVLHCTPGLPGEEK